MSKEDINIHGGIRTMAPAVRISNLAQRCVTVPDGCFVECGVWRGGCLAVMASIANTDGLNRAVYGFDSFEGLPPQTPEDSEDGQEFVGMCRATEAEVHETFTTWGVSLENTVLKKGWFNETIPEASKDMPSIAVLRLDGDWYESTLTCLEYLYPKIVPGGVIIVDDYLTWTGCKKAVDEYRALHKIDNILIETDPLGEVWWTK
ncbi:hypothetical protein SYK_24470 [Pseudodesulfovibrio nedwellii]|uniref:Macrocin O-methyltransferase n=1 Tax=Pseudodesulfovibrio nedwellii TaxID=2973072 RepID=A0ABN6S7L5_9BACT|nr:TylF/MycF/NovP-related O-methyltransferase [Pseudodesulfovibrio nedwellii]BDQ38087.1 hypothetical protein SYK_24470 [Pseudodesulfovibrio nedwellii]